MKWNVLWIQVFTSLQAIYFSWMQYSIFWYWLFQTDNISCIVFFECTLYLSRLYIALFYCCLTVPWLFCKVKMKHQYLLKNNDHEQSVEWWLWLTGVWCSAGGEEFVLSCAEGWWPLPLSRGRSMMLAGGPWPPPPGRWARGGRCLGRRNSWSCSL